MLFEDEAEAAVEIEITFAQHCSHHRKADHGADDAIVFQMVTIGAVAQKAPR